MGDDKPKITDAGAGETIAVTVQRPDRCGTCRFWKSRADPHHPEWGECRKDRPRCFDNGDEGWPCPAADEWCGAHERHFYITWHGASRRPLVDALEIISRYGGIDGAHHKQWVLDQVARALTGNGYATWVKGQTDGEDGPDTYEWDEGIAP